jgi:hypothetical protein
VTEKWRARHAKHKCQRANQSLAHARQSITIQA